MHRGILIDESHWPLVLLRVGEGLTAKEMEAYQRSFEKVLAKEKPFVAIALVRKTGDFDRRTISMWGEFTAQHQATMDRFWLGCAFVFPSEVLRFLLSAILLATPTAVPHGVFSTASKAMEWCKARTSPLGLDVPPLTEHQMWSGMV